LRSAITDVLTSGARFIMDRMGSHIGRRIRSRREELGYGEHEFAVLVGVSAERVSEIECGKDRPDAALLVHIASRLETSVAYLFADN